MPKSPNQPAELTSSTMVDEVLALSKEIMQDIYSIPPGDLRDRVSLICGMAVGFAARAESLEREKAKTKVTKRFPEGWCEACGQIVDKHGECGCPPF